MIELRIYYDFASPFCYVALEIARRLERERSDLRVDWLPFEVIDYLPDRGAMPQNPAFVRRGEAARTAKLAEEYVLEIHLRDRLLNSNLALCTVEHAKVVELETGRIGLARRVHAGLFEAFYRDRRDISNIGEVLTVAASHGLEDSLEDALRQGLYKSQVAKSRFDAQELGVVAVPTWLAGGFGVVGVPAYVDIERLLDTASAAPAAAPESKV
jgi:predicted DsbA family dithiol-disulfide isomerase